MSYHAMTNSKFPPADGIYEAEETTSEITLLLCHGWRTRWSPTQRRIRASCARGAAAG